MSVNEFAFERLIRLSMGSYPRLSQVHKFGTNTAVTATEEAVWSAGGAYTFPTTAETVRVKAGGNAADDQDGGAGMRTLTVQGLDETWAEASESINTEGADVGSATTTTFRRIFRAFGTVVGAYGAANTAAINIENSSTNTVLAQIAAGQGQTQMAVYTVPLGKRAYLVSMVRSVSTNQDASVRLYQRQNANDTATPFSGVKRLIHIADGLIGGDAIDFPLMPNFPAKTDIWAAAVGPAGGASVSVDFNLILVDD